MSLVKLLTEFPQYPARRVRRLATQLAYLENINSKEAKGIADDLMEFNLMQARTEAQMNDDVRIDMPPGQIDGVKTERILVTPHDQALRAVNLLLEEGGAFPDLADKARGIINGPSFYTDRTYSVEFKTAPAPRKELG